MIGRRSFVTGLAAGGLVLVSTPLLWAAPAPSLVGTWAFIGGAKQRRKHRESIEAAADALPWGLRETGLKRLSSTNPIVGRFEIRLDDSTIVVDYPGHEPMRSAPNGTPTKWRNTEGKRVDLTQKLKGSRMTQRISNSKGFRNTVFRVDPTNTFLSMNAIIDSRFMPKAVEYRLTYKRV